MSEKVRVDLGARSYDIQIGAGELDKLGQRIVEGLPWRRAVILTSPELVRLYGERVETSCREAGLEVATIEMPDGEHAKTLQAVGNALSQMARLNLDRRSFIIALGGGAIGDAAGFVASIFMRGVPYVQVPTTLLAMVDSSVGGKTGVNLPQGKNLVGAFRQPSLVVIDPLTLNSLPSRELRSGIAEIIKYGVIQDSELFSHLEEGTPPDWTPVIACCCAIKGRVVEQDEFETKDVRALLNFGHTIGHAIEAAAGFTQFLHGEAIAIGMVGAAYLSHKRAALSADDSDRIRSVVAKHGLPVAWPELPTEGVLKHLMRDKKFRNGRMRFILALEIGQACVSDEVTEEDVRLALEVCRGVDPHRMIA